MTEYRKLRSHVDTLFMARLAEVQEQKAGETSLTGYNLVAGRLTWLPERPYKILRVVPADFLAE